MVEAEMNIYREKNVAGSNKTTEQIRLADRDRLFSQICSKIF
jgi:hypothetical protein